jgi:hypothetical protein
MTFETDSRLACPPSALDLPLHPNFRVWRRLRERHIRRNNGRAATIVAIDRVSDV